MINLEHVEQRCLKHLMQVANPLVPIAALMAHLQDDEECRGVSERDLTDFLRKHELFRVMDPGDLVGDEEAGPRVILVTRIPTAPEIASKMKEEMRKMTEALAAAHAEAVKNGDTETLAKIAEVMKRAESLTQRLDETL